MNAFPRTRALFDDLARTLGLSGLTPGDDGGVALTVGDATTVLLYPQGDASLLVAVPVGPLPAEPGYALTQWLLRRNLHDTDLGPFRVAADEDGDVVLWGRVGLGSLDGDALARLVDALAVQAERVRLELQA